MKVLLFIFFVQKEKEKKKNRSIKIIKLFIINQWDTYYISYQLKIS